MRRTKRRATVAIVLVATLGAAAYSAVGYDTSGQSCGNAWSELGATGHRLTPQQEIALTQLEALELQTLRGGGDLFTSERTALLTLRDLARIRPTLCAEEARSRLLTSGLVIGCGPCWNTGMELGMHGVGRNGGETGATVPSPIPKLPWVLLWPLKATTPHYLAPPHYRTTPHYLTPRALLTTGQNMHRPH